MNDDETKLPHRLRRLCVTHTARTRPLFFVTICTHERQRLLASDRIHEQFIAFCRRAPEVAQVFVGRYVLMPDHIHVFVSCDGSHSLTRWVKALKGFLAKTWCDAGLSAPFWQESFFDHAMRSGESYGAKWDYVFQNPVRAGLVADAREWKWAGEMERLSWDQVRRLGESAYMYCMKIYSHIASETEGSRSRFSNAWKRERRLFPSLGKTGVSGFQCLETAVNRLRFLCVLR